MPNVSLTSLSSLEREGTWVFTQAVLPMAVFVISPRVMLWRRPICEDLEAGKIVYLVAYICVENGVKMYL